MKQNINLRDEITHPVFSGLAPDLDGPLLAELDRFSSLVNERSVSGWSEEGRNSGTTSPDPFCKASL
jgi:hypothetical protein